MLRESRAATAKRRALRGAVIALVSFASVSIGVPVAVAAQVYSKQGADYASYDPATDYIEACDMESDGHGVYMEYWTYGGNHRYEWDGNGSQGGCGNDWIDDIRRFRVCEDKVGCGND